MYDSRAKALRLKKSFPGLKKAFPIIRIHIYISSNVYCIEIFLCVI